MLVSDWILTSRQPHRVEDESHIFKILLHLFTESWVKKKIFFNSCLTVVDTSLSTEDTTKSNTTVLTKLISVFTFQQFTSYKCIFKHVLCIVSIDVRGVIKSQAYVWVTVMVHNIPRALSTGTGVNPSWRRAMWPILFRGPQGNLR